MVPLKAVADMAAERYATEPTAKAGVPPRAISKAYSASLVEDA